jgi:LysR family transcriptional regulator, glycine cleavage system transcriptional activator
MYRGLPPISTLRAFEAAARLRGFSAASTELSVTHSAVSQQIRTLEKRVGYTLFYRSGNKMLLTEQGKRLADRIVVILEGMALAFPVESKSHPSSDNTLILEVMAPIAENWLLPRLKEFKKLHSDIVLNITTIPDLASLYDETANISMRYGDGHWAGVEKIKLRDELVFPACSPDFLKGHPDVSLQNMMSLPLLRHALISWRHWCEKAGLPVESPGNTVTFNDVAHGIHAALAGKGIVLARYLMVKDHLESGRLVRLFDIAVPGTYSYYLVWRPNKVKEAAMAAFRNWVVAAMAQDESQTRSNIADTNRGLS